MAVRRRQVQDDAREVQLAELLNLHRSDRRTGHDATDEHGNPFEFKTTTTRSLTTGRDIGPQYLARMRSRFLIAAKGQNTDYGFSFDDIYFLHPDDLDPWIQRIESRLAADAAIVSLAYNALVAQGADTATLDRLAAIGKRGSTINNPKIPWTYITAHGTRLGQAPPLNLRDLIAGRPLPAADADA